MTPASVLPDLSPAPPAASAPAPAGTAPAPAGWYDLADWVSVGALALAGTATPTPADVAAAETVVLAVYRRMTHAVTSIVTTALRRPAYLDWLAAQPVEDDDLMSPTARAAACVADVLGVPRAT